MKILGIETSCDETAAAVVENGTTILSNVVASQEELHRQYGGIVPEIASRQHMISIIPIVDQALSHSNIMPEDLDAIAVTNRPGLVGSLLIGVNMAKALALVWHKPLFAVDHIRAHIYANWLEQNAPQFPCIALVVSGGHTELILIQRNGEFKRLGGTRDDAAGEAFDKVARILKLGYPGGPAIEFAAGQGVPLHRLPRAWLKGSDDFSFSGLKTAVLHLSEKLGITSTEGLHPHIPNVAASFQESVVDVLAAKTIQAAKRERVNQILLAGGVAANTVLKETFLIRSPVEVIIPSPQLCTDNAAMVSACAFHNRSSPIQNRWDMDVYSISKYV